MGAKKLWVDTVRNALIPNDGSMSSQDLSLTGPPARFPRASELAGQFITLRSLDPARDVEALYECSHGDEERAAIWLWMTYGPFEDRDAMLAFLHGLAAMSNTVFYTVFDTEGRPIGVVSFLHIEPVCRSLEIGHIWYTPRVQRTKVNTEASYLLIREGFRLGNRRIEWRCNADNEKSRNAALRLGFTYEGTLRQHLISKGQNRDTCTFSMLDGEWPAIQEVLETWLYETEGPTLREVMQRLRP